MGEKEHTETSEMVVDVHRLPMPLGNVVQLVHDAHVRVFLGDVDPPVPGLLVSLSLGNKWVGETYQALRWMPSWVNASRPSRERK